MFRDGVREGGPRVFRYGGREETPIFPYIPDMILTNASFVVCSAGTKLPSTGAPAERLRKQMMVLGVWGQEHSPCLC